MAKYEALPADPMRHYPPRVVLDDGHGQVIPVLNEIIREKDFPLDSSRLLQNFAALLNGNPPLHRLSSAENQIYYQRLPGGIALHSRACQGGVSALGFLLTVPAHEESAILGAAALHKVNPTFMQILCDAIDMAKPPAEQAANPSRQSPGPTT